MLKRGADEVLSFCLPSGTVGDRIRPMPSGRWRCESILPEVEGQLGVFDQDPAP